MIKQLMPYGSSRYSALVAKVGTAKQAPSKDEAVLLPYGEAGLAGIAAKVGTAKTDHSGSAVSVVRLNARQR